jgi:hypothetical protein
MDHRVKETSNPNICFSFYVFGKPAVHFSKFSPPLPLTEVSLQPSAIPGGTTH